MMAITTNSSMSVNARRFVVGCDKRPQPVVLLDITTPCPAFEFGVTAGPLKGAVRRGYTGDAL
jgi:hypothetical protein